MRGKKQILTIVLPVVGLIAIVAVLCVILLKPQGLNDTYFINSDRRIVASIDNPSEKLLFGAKKIHKVYEVDDDTVKSYKLYYVFSDAKEADDKFVEVKHKSLEDILVKEVSQEGKYIIVTMDKMTYEGKSPATIKKQLRGEGIPLISNPQEPTEGDPSEPNEALDEENE